MTPILFPSLSGDIKDVKSGDIVFVRRKDRWISNAMAWFMSSEWSHTATVYDIGELDIHTVETSDLEMTCGMLGEYLLDSERYTVEVWRIHGADYPEHGLTALRGMLGTLYGYLQLIPFAVRCMLQKWTKFCVRKNIEWASIPAPRNTWVRQGQVCTASAYTYLKASRTPGFMDVDPEAFHTQDLYNDVTTHPGRKLILTSRKV